MIVWAWPAVQPEVLVGAVIWIAAAKVAKARTATVLKSIVKSVELESVSVSDEEVERERDSEGWVRVGNLYPLSLKSGTLEVCKTGGFCSFASCGTEVAIHGMRGDARGSALYSSSRAAASLRFSGQLS